MRLQRALARAGIASRRAAEDLIRAGRVRVNGVVAELGTKVDVGTDIVTVGGRRLPAAGRTVWIALHKPLGYVVTKRDPEGRPTVFELIPPIPGLTYVGRLDVMTAGLLLLTTDGEGAHRLMHPRFAVERTYRALVHGRTLPDLQRALRAPIPIDGRPVRIVRHKAHPDQGNSIDLTLTLAEGRNRIVRRLCEELNLKVERLTRLSYGSIRLGRLPAGAWRHLSAEEQQALRREIGAGAGGRGGREGPKARS